MPGFLALYSYSDVAPGRSMGEGTCVVAVQGQLFSDAAAEFVQREQPQWQSWLEELTIRSFLSHTAAARARR